MTVTLALAGDTMLGRSVARTLATTPPEALVAPEVRAAMGQADLVVLNLECCISERGRRWEAPGKPFFFRAPARAVELLALLGTDCATLANNHALDYGVDALADTLDHLAAAGIATVGAGSDLDQARRPAMLTAGGLRVAVLGVTDHPADFAAGPGRPGVAFADLAHQVPGWLAELVREAGAEADITLVTPHWGPNMTAAPVRHVRRAAGALVDAGATLVAGHSAHVPHGVAGPVPPAGSAPSQAGLLPHPPGGGRGRGLDRAPLPQRLRRPRHHGPGHGRPADRQVALADRRRKLCGQLNAPCGLIRRFVLTR
jgi:poly-gamma-glutamate synthesis protein (capsule biosynthesis protein)